MSKIYIDNPISSDFAMVPNVLWRWPGLSFKAKGFFAYLLSHRHGSMPAVAGMERETGLGRDARKAAMRELIAAGLASWQVRRDPSGRLLDKVLSVSTRPLLAVIASGDMGQPALSPDNPSHGRVDALSPEKPSDGKSGGHVTETRRCAAEKPAILQDKKKQEARSVVAKPRAVPPARSGCSGGMAASPGFDGQGVSLDISALSAFQRARLRSGQSVVIGKAVVAAGSVELARLQAALSGVPA